ncbi:hypothetical protein COLINT_02766 [Collinsella intestinalis DSM 13280]|uniref:Uncharacterized protein n=1 Tax=Collinsella intestinalis DSM 13280 TaxID=521003 RepID=C4F9N2_9ACTN|nr:hypothetical protein COLINT_02766 [Collinsella intestinalis DSM 13280]
MRNSSEENGECMHYGGAPSRYQYGQFFDRWTTTPSERVFGMVTVGPH